MKTTITIDRNVISYKRSDAIQKVNRELGAKATINGNVITVQSDLDGNKVISILDRLGVDYAKSRGY
jgi:translation initiation factor 1 (eIF-1/SUI1)